MQIDDIRQYNSPNWNTLYEVATNNTTHLNNRILYFISYGRIAFLVSTVKNEANWRYPH